MHQVKQKVVSTRNVQTIMATSTIRDAAQKLVFNAILKITAI